MEEAPNKIYLCPSDRVDEEYEDEWYYNPWGEGFVEYTHTDAFIKRTEEYLYKQLNEGNMECGDIETFIESFKKYMED